MNEMESGFRCQGKGQKVPAACAKAHGAGIHPPRGEMGILGRGEEELSF